jgi:hypothetical protein
LIAFNIRMLGEIMRTSIPVLFMAGLWNLLSGKFRFETAELGKRFYMEDGKAFRIFRRVRRRAGGLPPAEGAFRVRFKPARMSVEQNIRFSRLPMIAMLGFPGFRAKYWTVADETGLCQGIYEWDRLEDARAYASSVALAFMTKRSEPGSVSFEVIDQGTTRYWACQGPAGAAMQDAK